MLIRKILNQTDYLLSESSIKNYERAIWQMAGGNPLAIFLAVAYFHTHQGQVSTQSSADLTALYENTFLSLDTDARKGWCLLALLPAEDYRFEDMLRIFAPRISQEALDKLIQSHIIASVTDERTGYVAFRITNSAQTYIAKLYETEISVKRIIDTEVVAVNSHQLGLLIVENILLSRWIRIPQELQVEWILQWHKEGIRRQRWSVWRLLLDTYLDAGAPYDPEIRISYAMCLRNLGEWRLAHEIFEEVVFRCGQKGQFKCQARALLELAITFRYQGEYQRGRLSLARAERIALRQNETELLSAITVEHAQVLVDLKEQQAVEPLLSKMPNTLHGQVLSSDIYLLMGEVEKSRAVAHHALEMDDHIASVEGRIRTILGQGYEQQNKLDLAHEQLMLAVVKLEQQNDIFGLSRAQTNLGALLLRMEQFEDAETLLTDAERSQILLHDRVGLATTRHNLHVLHIAQSGLSTLQ